MAKIIQKMLFLLALLLIPSCIGVPIVPFEPALRGIEIVEVKLQAGTNPITA